MNGTERHVTEGKLTKVVFKQTIDNESEFEKLLSLFPAMKKYKPKDIDFTQINCKFVMKKL